MSQVCGIGQGVAEMAKTVLVVKRFLDVTLIVLIVGVIGSALMQMEVAVPMRTAVVLVPAHFAPDKGQLEVRNQILGTGFIGDGSGLATFEVPLASWPALVFFLALAVGFAPMFVLVILLRRIAATLVEGDPFTEANVNRIRAIGGLVMAFEFFRGAAQLGLAALVAGTSTMRGFTLLSWGEWNFLTFVLGLVIIGLAEVFRYGMRLQTDVDLTV
jgi:hypothetical protein